MKVAGGARERERGNFFLGIVCLVWSLTNSSCSPSSFRKYKHEYCSHYRSARTNLKENTPAQRLIPKETEKYTRGKKKCINIKTNTQMQRKIYKNKDKCLDNYHEMNIPNGQQQIRVHLLFSIVLFQELVVLP